VYLFAAADINWSIIKLWPLKAGVGRHRAQGTRHRAQGTGHRAQGTQGRSGEAAFSSLYISMCGGEANNCCVLVGTRW